MSEDVLEDYSNLPALISDDSSDESGEELICLPVVTTLPSKVQEYLYSNTKEAQYFRHCITQINKNVVLKRLKNS